MAKCNGIYLYSSDPALQGLADKLLSDYRAKEYAESTCQTLYLFCTYSCGIVHTFYRKHGFRRRVDTTKNVKSQTTDVIKPAPTTTTKLKFTLRPQRVYVGHIIVFFIHYCIYISKELPLTLCMARLKRSNMCTNPKGRVRRINHFKNDAHMIIRVDSGFTQISCI